MVYRRNDTRTEMIAIEVKIYIGIGFLSSTITEAESAIVRPTKLQIPNAVPHSVIGNRNGVDK